jgi:hypothetical protein
MKNIARNSIEGHEFVIEVAIVHHTNHHNLASIQGWLHG